MQLHSLLKLSNMAWYYCGFKWTFNSIPCTHEMSLIGYLKRNFPWKQFCKEILKIIATCNTAGNENRIKVRIWFVLYLNNALSADLRGGHLFRAGVDRPQAAAAQQHEPGVPAVAHRFVAHLHTNLMAEIIWNKTSEIKKTCTFTLLWNVDLCWCYRVLTCNWFPRMAAPDLASGLLFQERQAGHLSDHDHPQPLRLALPHQKNILHGQVSPYLTVNFAKW